MRVPAARVQEGRTSGAVKDRKAQPASAPAPSAATKQATRRRRRQRLISRLRRQARRWARCARGPGAGRAAHAARVWRAW